MDFVVSIFSSTYVFNLLFTLGIDEVFLFLFKLLLLFFLPIFIVEDVI